MIIVGANQATCPVTSLTGMSKYMHNYISISEERVSVASVCNGNARAAGPFPASL